MSSDFTPPRSVEIDPLPFLQELFQKPLHKDLHDNEEICPICHGIGLVVRNNEYGLSDDPNKRVAWFPYKHQSISFCNNCYNGVIKICKYCGENKTRCFHDCAGTRAERAVAQHVKDDETLQKAKKISADSIEATNMKMLFSEHYPYSNGYFSEWEDFFDAWFDSHNDEDEKPEYVNGTTEIGLEIDMGDVVSDACADLHDDASNNISGLDELQKYVSSWCAEQSGCDTYFQNENIAVKIPWEKYS